MKDYTKRLILLIFILFITLFMIFLVVKIYNKKIEENSLSSNIKNYLTEINYEEITNHIVEVPNTIIYVSNSSDNKSQKFEKEFIKVIKKYNLENEIIFININNTTILEPFYQNAPELIFYKNSQISDVINCDVLKSDKNIIKILKERGVIND